MQWVPLWGLKNVLIKMGKAAQVVTPSGFPKFLSWMKGADDVINYEDDKVRAVDRIKDAKALIFVDFNSLKRISELKHCGIRV